MFSVIKASGLAVFLSLMLAACGGLVAPAVPGNFRMAGNQSDLIILSWESPSGGSAATVYEVSRDGNVIAPAVTDTSFVDRGLTPSTAYTYKLRARDAAGNWSAQTAALVVSTLPGSGLNPPDSANVPAGYLRVWSEEFDYTGLPDSSKWSYDTWGNGFGWGNNEQEYYTTANLENARVGDGKLFITALKKDTVVNSELTLHYTSARLVTQEEDLTKASWTYGYFEVRAKMPCGRGTWPAIWMTGTGRRWPQDGEIDILEHFNGMDIIASANVHWGVWPDHFETKPRDQWVPTICTAFHNYWMKWTADQIVIGVDSTPTLIHSKPAGNPSYAEWPFINPQAFILNLAIGGNGTGNVEVDDTMFPRSVEVEYVRVYQLP